MVRRMPQLGALRTFEAAARHLSFKGAASELGVTPTAVSHQVRSLEEALGVPLFTRRTRAIGLSDAGRILAPIIHDSLLRIQAGLEEVTASEAVVTITTTPGFAALRLIPQLGRFYAAHPHLSVQLDASTGLVDLVRDRRIDIAIRYGSGDYDGLHTVPLTSESFRAYGAPNLVASLKSPFETTLFETAWQQPVLANVSWTTWLAAASVRPGRRRVRIERFPDEHFVLQAAAGGQGLVLTSSVLARGMIANGLLAPYRPEIALAGARYLAVCLPEKARSPKVRLVVDWLGSITQEDREA